MSKYNESDAHGVMYNPNDSVDQRFAQCQKLAGAFDSWFLVFSIVSYSVFDVGVFGCCGFVCDVAFSVV